MKRDKEHIDRKKEESREDIREESQRIAKSNAEEFTSMSKAESDHFSKSSISNADKPKPSTGGYGDQHDPERHENIKKKESEKSIPKKIDRDSYNQGFRDGTERAARYYDQLKNSEKSSSESYKRYDPGYVEESSNQPFNNYGEVDENSSRSYPSMQSGYGDKSKNETRMSSEQSEQVNYSHPENKSKSGDREPKKSDDLRHLRNEPKEREKGDRNREW